MSGFPRDWPISLSRRRDSWLAPFSTPLLPFSINNDYLEAGLPNAHAVGDGIAARLRQRLVDYSPGRAVVIRVVNENLNWASYLFMLWSMGGGSLKQEQEPERAVGVLGGAAALQFLRKVLKKIMAADDDSDWQDTKGYLERLGITTENIDKFLEWIADLLELHLSLLNASIFGVLISDLPAQETEQAQVAIYKNEGCVALGSAVLVPLFYLLRKKLDEGAMKPLFDSLVMTTDMRKKLKKEAGELPSEYLSRVTGVLGGSKVNLFLDLVNYMAAALVPIFIAVAVFRDDDKRTLADTDKSSVAIVFVGSLLASVWRRYLMMKDGERHNGLALFLSFIGSLVMAEWFSEVMQQMLLPESEISLLPGKVCFSAFFCLYLASRMYVDSENQVVAESRLIVFKEKLYDDIASSLVNKIFVEGEGLEEARRTKLLMLMSAAPSCPYENIVNISDDAFKSRVEIGLRSFLKNLKVDNLGDAAADRDLLKELSTFQVESLATFLEETGINLNASEDDESSSEDDESSSEGASGASASGAEDDASGSEDAAAAGAKALVELQTLAKQLADDAIFSAIAGLQAAASTTPVAAAAAEHPTPNTQHPTPNTQYPTHPSKMINL